ncbi:SCO family protein [Paenibacillus filicis]|uniref:SCO family protein n=1 Tax=Paenibacillus gyeongsangnamensis TaxID=3388067 RepID=A0ABT4QLC4_9BACL|nr:SCO family protein [Paenibacillus filicis]MCZ8517506.1 SCO family protein [Paenibacillus filicis]
MAQKNGFKLTVMVLLVALIAILAYMLLKGPKQTYDVIQKAPDFKLMNLDGKEVTLADTAGKGKLVYFFYSTCPDVCPPTTYTLSKIQDVLVKKGEFGTKTQILSISFDPTKDTPAQLKEFSGRYHPDYKGWYFLRGEEGPTIELAKKFGVLITKDPQGTFTHMNWILLVDGKGNLRNYYDGSDPNLNVEKIADDMIQVSKN